MKEWNDIEKLIIGDSEKMGMTFKDEFWDEMENILDKSEAIASITPLHGNDNLDSSSDGPFQESYWDEMSLILDKEDKKKRRSLILRWIFDIAAILLLMFMVIPSNSRINSTKETSKLIASEKMEQDQASTANSSSDEITSITPENSTNELAEIKSTQPGQNTSKEDLAFNEAKESRIGKSIEIETETASMLASASASNLLVNTSSTIRKKAVKSQESIQSMATYPPIAFNISKPNIVGQVELVNSKAFPPRTFIRPISIQLSLASNIALAPSGNISNASRIGSSNTFGIEVLKHQVNWSYSLGANFAHRTGINHEMLITKSTYGTRLYRDYQSVTYKSIGSIGIPVGVNYHRKRNVFGLKITPSWNMMVNSTYHRYNNYNSDELLVKNNYGIKEGVNPFDLRFQLMYQRRISEKFTLGINASTGIFNQIDNNLIPDTKGLNEYSIGLNVNYTLIDF